MATAIANPYFARFQTNGFKPVSTASFDNEFARLAKAQATQLAAATSTPHVPVLNSLVSYLPLASSTFNYNFENTLSAEFDALAKHKNLVEGSKAYKKHLKAATDQREKLYSVNVAELKFFNAYKSVKDFKLNTSLPLDSNFRNLSVARDWGGKKCVKRWRAVLFEAQKHVKAKTSPSAPSTHGDTQSVVSSAPASRTSGVRLSNVQDDQGSVISEANTELSNTASTYFSSFLDRGFIPNPSANLEQEFNRLSLHQGWTPNSSERTRQWAQALESEFVLCFGSSRKLESWQKLCQELGAVDVPTSITQCKKFLDGIHVHILEFIKGTRHRPGSGNANGEDVNALIREHQVPTYKTVTALYKRCMKIGFFPKVEAKQDTFLKALLRNFHHKRNLV